MNILQVFNNMLTVQEWEKKLNSVCLRFYRFHIHFTNTDDLLLCFLPYHESKIFVRVLQLIRFDSKLASKWDWIEPLQVNTGFPTICSSILPQLPVNVAKCFFQAILYIFCIC